MKIQITIIFLLFSSLLFAQNVNIDWGEANKNESFVNRILGETKTEVVALASKGEDFYIETYDVNSMKLKQSNKFELPKEQDKKTEIEKIHFFPASQKIVLFTSLYKDKTSVIYYYEIGLDATVSQGTVLMEIEVQKKGLKGHFGFDEAIGGNTILVYHTSKLRKEKVKQISVKVIDAQINLIADLSDKIPLKDDKKEVFVSNIIYNSKGYIHMLVEKPNKKYVDFFFYTYNINKDYEQQKFSVALDKDHIISGIGLGITAEGNLVAGGYYSDFAGVFKGITQQGVFVLEYAPSQNILLSKKLSPYQEKHFDKAFGKLGKKMYKGFPAEINRLREIIIKDDGSLTLVSEYIYVVSGGGVGPIALTTYMYGIIVVTDIAKEGTINWLAAIPKMQVFRRPSLNISAGIGGGGGIAVLGFSIALMKDKSVYLSYLLSVQDGYLHFIYNDNPKNITTPIDKTAKPMQNLNQGVPTLVSMDSEGNMKREFLPGAKNDELILRPRISKRVDNRTIYVSGSKKKFDKIGRITFKKNIPVKRT